MLNYERVAGNSCFYGRKFGDFRGNIGDFSVGDKLGVGKRGDLSRTHGASTKKNVDLYPLVNIQKAIENGHL
jgi:hypothetical protein